MSFVLRGVRQEDLGGLMELTQQFGLLNLPANRKVLQEKINRSEASFRGDLNRDESEYLFVVSDEETSAVVGSGLIMAKHGTPRSPHHSFKVLKKDHFSKDLGIGFIHQVLRLNADTNGPSEIGGLLVDKNYRRRPEKLGRQVSLIRFVYMGMKSDSFEDRVICELTAPLTEEGRSEFWEALGRRFTGLPYQEADLISQQHKEFITTLFPAQDIYLTLLSSKARLVLGRVGEETRPAQHLLEKIGFRYLEEVDPFDGGPHYGANLSDISIIKRLKFLSVAQGTPHFSSMGFVALERDGEFRAMQTSLEVKGNDVVIPEGTRRRLQLDVGSVVSVVELSTF